MKTQGRSLIIIATLLVVASAMSRLVLYPYNFSPMIAMALFGGAVIKDKKYAIALPLFAMLLSDVLFEVLHIAVGFWGWGQLIGYGIMIGITFLGSFIRKINVVSVGATTLLSSLIFFFLSNSSVFFLEGNYNPTYASDFSGYINCLAAGLPFLKNSLIADLTFSAILFGAYYISMQNVKQVALAKTK